MILAISRFRVANAMEGAVARAFLERPHLVDNSPGFLGLEVFTDTKDATVFYLVTRWTDQVSFQTWHRSAAHHRSHAWIPKGLKLDATYTQVVVLDRLPPPEGTPPPLEEALADTVPLLRHFLDTAHSVQYVQASPDGTIRQCNAAVARHLHVPHDQLLGQTLWPYLPDPDAAQLRALVTTGERHLAERVRLTFCDATHAPYTLECQVDVQPDGFTIIGEPPPHPAGPTPTKWLSSS